MKCLDCGYDIQEDELEEHQWHDVIEGFFDEEDLEVSDAKPKTS